MIIVFRKQKCVKAAGFRKQSAGIATGAYFAPLDHIGSARSSRVWHLVLVCMAIGAGAYAALHFSVWLMLAIAMPSACIAALIFIIEKACGKSSFTCSPHILSITVIPPETAP